MSISTGVINFDKEWMTRNREMQSFFYKMEKEFNFKVAYHKGDLRFVIIVLDGPNFRITWTNYHPVSSAYSGERIEFSRPAAWYCNATKSIEFKYKFISIEELLQLEHSKKFRKFLIFNLDKLSV